MLLCLTLVAAALHTPIRPRANTRHAAVLASEQQRFHRSTDLLCLGPTVTATEVVNVLGRWTTYKEWDSIGELKQMDKLFDESGRFKTSKQAQQSSGLLSAKRGNGDWVQKTPERRSFCVRQGLVQRYWFAQNVGQLPFRSKALAASVGSSVAELSRQPINPLAVDVAFDALAQSKSGILKREVCDARRASYEGADGFDAEALSSDLFRGRLKVVGSSLLFPGGPFLLQAGLFFKLDGASKTLEYLADSQEKLFGASFL